MWPHLCLIAVEILWFQQKLLNLKFEVCFCSISLLLFLGDMVCISVAAEEI